MSMSAELEKLAALHGRGALTDAEYAAAKQRVLTGWPEPMQRVSRLRRSLSDRWLGGVCGGLAEATGAESWIWRAIFVLGAFCGGFTVLLYVLLWIFVPVEGTAPT
jgi:phage shock protein C